MKKEKERCVKSVVLCIYLLLTAIYLSLNCPALTGSNRGHLYTPTLSGNTRDDTSAGETRRVEEVAPNHLLFGSVRSHWRLTRQIQSYDGE